MTPGEEAAAARRGAGLFRLAHRGVVEVRGGDRSRWLDGMVSGDVRSLAEPGRSGCPALVLTAQGRIVAELHVLARPDAYWLDLEARAIPDLIAHLSKYVIADDVELEDRRGALVRLAVEGPAAPRIVAGALGAPLELEPGACAGLTHAGSPLVVAAYGFSGSPARQLFAAPAAEQALLGALREAGGADLVPGSPEALEILRVEAGVPRLGAELDDSVLPAEARLERAVARNKGCYTGQEVVERLRSQGQPSHLLVGLAAEREEPPPVGAALERDGSRVGEVTSACRSPAAGAIALGFVRRASADPGTPLSAAGVRLSVVALPFVDGAAG